jgi:hypothetical protein
MVETEVETKQILVVDIQPDTTAAEAEALLNEPLSRGYCFQYISGGWDQLGARAFFRLRTGSDCEAAAEVERAIVPARAASQVGRVQALLADPALRFISAKGQPPARWTTAK